MLMHNIIPRLSGTPGRFRSPAPPISDSTRGSVLESIGIDADRIDALATEGVIRQA